MSNPRPLTATHLQELAGKTAFLRGRAYANSGVVHITQQDAQAVSAKVMGSANYTVGLQFKNAWLSGSCTCPVGRRGEFCKHQVALGLCWIGPREASTPSAETGKRGKAATKATAKQHHSPEAAVQGWLQAQSAEALRTLVLSMAARDRDLWRELVSRARLTQAAPEAHRKAIAELIGRKRFMDYAATMRYADRLQTLVTLLETEINAAPAQALELIDYAMLRLIGVYAEVDDSSGALGDVVAQLAQLHGQAASVLHDVPGLANGLLKLTLADDWGMLGDITMYAAALGRKGLDELDRDVAAQLDALPINTSKGRFSVDPHGSERRKLLVLSRQLAQHGGDVDALLRRRENAGLSFGVDYIEMSQICREHGRARIATQWLERGLKALPKELCLLDALADVRQADGFNEEATALVWEAFLLQPHEKYFLRLRDSVDDVAWPQWRERALAHVRQKFGDDQWVYLNLAEHNVGAVVDMLPQAKLAVPTWRVLMHALAPDYPELALRAARTVVLDILSAANKRAYADALMQMKTMRRLYERQQDTAGFAGYLAELRTTHRAKRSFIEALDTAFAG